MTMTRSKDQAYFDLIDTDQHLVVLVGELNEQWTLLAQSELKKANVPFSFSRGPSLKRRGLRANGYVFPSFNSGTKGSFRLRLSDSAKTATAGLPTPLPRYRPQATEIIQKR
jgi:hypothetical protein